MKDHPKSMISAYIDGELTGKERQQVEDHLSECTPCRRCFDDLVSQTKSIRNFYRAVDVPEEIPNRVMAALREKKLQPLAAGPVAVVVLLGLAIFFLTGMLLFGSGLTHPLVSVSLSLIHILPLLAMVPFLVEVLLVSAVIVLLLSAWYLRRLLA